MSGYPIQRPPATLPEHAALNKRVDRIVLRTATPRNRSEEEIAQAPTSLREALVSLQAERCRGLEIDQLAAGFVEVAADRGNRVQGPIDADHGKISVDELDGGRGHRHDVGPVLVKYAVLTRDPDIESDLTRDPGRVTSGTITQTP